MIKFSNLKLHPMESKLPAVLILALVLTLPVYGAGHHHDFHHVAEMHCTEASMSNESTINLSGIERFENQVYLEGELVNLSSIDCSKISAHEWEREETTAPNTNIHLSVSVLIALLLPILFTFSQREYFEEEYNRVIILNLLIPLTALAVSYIALAMGLSFPIILLFLLIAPFLAYIGIANLLLDDNVRRFFYLSLITYCFFWSVFLVTFWFIWVFFDPVVL